MRPQDILTPVASGLCCKPGGFHIDPLRPVERAVITHGQEDALVHWCTSRGLTARPLALVGYGDEEAEATLPDGEAEP